MPASKEELTAAMARIHDALQCMVGPTGEVIHLHSKAAAIAWHLARAGVDVTPDRAIIKAQPIPNRPGQLPGLVRWVAADAPDLAVEPGSELISAQGPPPDLAALDALLPWHVKTKIQGVFQ